MADNSCLLNLALLQNVTFVFQMVETCYFVVWCRIRIHLKFCSNYLLQEKLRRTSSPVFERKEDRKTTWHRPAAFNKIYHCCQLQLPLYPTQMVTNCKLSHVFCSLRQNEFPPDSPKPTEFPPVNSPSGQHSGEFRLRRVESQEEAEGGDWLEEGGGGARKRKRLYPAAALGVSRWASFESFVRRRSRIVFMGVCSAWWRFQLQLVLWGICWWRTGRRVSRISFKMTAGLLRFPANRWEV